MSPTMPPTQPPSLPPRGWSSADVARIVTVGLAVWFGVQLLWATSSLVFLVFLATLFGVSVAQGVDRLERWGIRRGVASALLVFGVVGTIGGVLGASAPTLIREARVLQRDVPAALTKLQGWVEARRGGWLGSLLSAPSATATPPATVVPAPAGGEAPRGAGEARAADAPVAPRGSEPPLATPAPAASSVTTLLGDRLSTGLAGASRLLLSLVSGTAAVL
ncbi:MAG: AI-2E family transporter, partial [Gemmatimonadetes bacterium]|nr:AI-2E family transporter [Gemmatimonadota bacterium]